MVVHAAASAFLMLTSESVEKQSLFKWILVIPAGGKKKKANTRYFVAPTAAEKSDCDGAKLFSC